MEIYNKIKLLYIFREELKVYFCKSMCTLGAAK